MNKIISDSNAVASDWEATCVGSVARANTYGAGLWAIQFRSPSVSPAPVLFTFVGAGVGLGGFGVSATEDTINTNKNSENSQVGFTALECINPFSLSELNSSTGRLTVAEAYFFGFGGSVVIITAMDREKGRVF